MSATANAIFIWIPKSAGTSISHTLRLPVYTTLDSIRNDFGNQGYVTFAHFDYARLVSEGHISETYYRDAFKFTFARNPFDRAVSLFFYLRLAKRFPTHYSFAQFIHHLVDHGYESIGLFNSEGLSQCNPQMRWIRGSEIDFFGRYETLQVDIVYLCQQLGLPPYKIAHLNRTTHRPYADYYDPSTVRLVRSLYAEDFEHLGYDTDLPT